MLKRSLLSFVLIAGLACPAAQAFSVVDSASNVWSSVKSGMTTASDAACNTCNGAKGFVFGNAKNLCAMVAANKKETVAGVLGFAVVCAAACYAYKHFVTDKK
jgi:hypothetical protein